MKKMFQALEEIEAKVEIQKKLKRKSKYPKWVSQQKMENHRKKVFLNLQHLK